MSLKDLFNQAVGNSTKKLMGIAQAPKANWEKDFIGKRLNIKGEIVTVETIVGSKVKPMFYEVNGKHLIGVHRALCQMTGDKKITDEEFDIIEQTEFFVEMVKKEPPLAMEVPKKIEFPK